MLMYKKTSLPRSMLFCDFEIVLNTKQDLLMVDFYSSLP